MKNYIVYKHTSPNGKVYIGITCQNPEYRWNHGRGYYQNKYFTAAIDKYRWENFTHEILFSGLSKEDACRMEKALIKKYDSMNPHKGYNQTEGGDDGCLGFKMTDEMKSKISASNRRRKLSTETRQKIARLHSHPVNVYLASDNTLVATFVSTTEAALHFGVSRDVVYNNIKGNLRTFCAGKYIAQYA